MLTLLTTACGALSAVPESADRVDLEKETAIKGTVETEGYQWSYEITSYTVTGEHYASDDPDILLMRHSYQIPSMKVSVPAGDKRREAENAARAVADAFNGYFEEKLKEEVAWFEEMAAIAEEDYAARVKEGGANHDPVAYSDETTLDFWTDGSMLCVTTAESSYTGGAHGFSRRSVFNFDLRSGKQITLTDLVADDKGLQLAVEEELLRQVEERQAGAEGKLFFDDCAETLGEWMAREVAFRDEGMEIIFGLYDIAPYASGEQTFIIPYQMMEQYLNGYGRELLGL